MRGSLNKFLFLAKWYDIYKKMNVFFLSQSGGIYKIMKTIKFIFYEEQIPNWYGGNLRKLKSILFYSQPYMCNIQDRISYGIFNWWVDTGRFIWKWYWQIISFFIIFFIRFTSESLDHICVFCSSVSNTVSNIIIRGERF